MVIDHAYASGTFGPHLRPNAAAVIGHSMGGYTALAIAGAIPTSLPHETPGQPPQTLDMIPDARVRAIVLLAPATPWYQAPGALDRVRLPILMLTAERDPHTPAGHALIVEHGLPDRSVLQHRVVPNAGHFSFLSPFPPHMTKPEFPPSQDPKGFDRAAFQVEMNAEITGFLDRHLGQ